MGYSTKSLEFDEDETYGVSTENVGSLVVVVGGSRELKMDDEELEGEVDVCTVEEDPAGLVEVIDVGGGEREVEDIVADNAEIVNEQERSISMHVPGTMRVHVLSELEMEETA